MDGSDREGNYKTAATGACRRWLVDGLIREAGLFNHSAGLAVYSQYIAR
jgi:hypothetical protein